MNIIAVDDERIALAALTDAIRKAEPDAHIESFRDAMSVMAYVSENPVDVAFLDIEMRGMNGINLAQTIKCIRPKLNIIFATGYSEYRADAFDMHASGYLTKPITVDNVRRELDNLRFPIEGETAAETVTEMGAPNADAEPELRVQTFGNFEVYHRGVPITFKYEKSKEVLAYLIDRATVCSTNEIMAALWEDDNHESYMRNLRKDLADTFTALGCKDALIIQWGKLGVIPDRFSCDYYDWKKGLPYALNAYRGEYMMQYSWSEFRRADFEL